MVAQTINLKIQKKTWEMFQSFLPYYLDTVNTLTPTAIKIYDFLLEECKKNHSIVVILNPKQKMREAGLITGLINNSNNSTYGKAMKILQSLGLIGYQPYRNGKLYNSYVIIVPLETFYDNWKITYNFDKRKRKPKDYIDYFDIEEVRLNAKNYLKENYNIEI